MDIYTSIEAISILSFILFSLLCFTRIENNTDINKIAYLFSLFFQAFLGFVYYIFVLNFISNKLALVASLLIVILFSSFFYLIYIFIPIYKTTCTFCSVLFNNYYF